MPGAGDGPVGSLIVQNEKIIGEGIEGETHKDITFHAEIEAIRGAHFFYGITEARILKI